MILKVFPNLKELWIPPVSPFTLSLNESLAAWLELPWLELRLLDKARISRFLCMKCSCLIMHHLTQKKFILACFCHSFEVSTSSKSVWRFSNRLYVEHCCQHLKTHISWRQMLGRQFERQLKKSYSLNFCPLTERFLIVLSQFVVECFHNLKHNIWCTLFILRKWLLK